MLSRMNTFAKISVIILMLLAPIIGLFSYSNRTSTRVVEEQLIQSNYNRLTYFLDQMDASSDQLWRTAYVTMQNPNAIRLQNKPVRGLSFETIRNQSEVEEDLRQRSASLPWDNELTLYAPAMDTVVTTNLKRDYTLDYFLAYEINTWTYRELALNGIKEPYFVRHMTKPFTLQWEDSGMGLIMEVAVPVRHIAGMLQQLKAGSAGEPIFYHPQAGAVVSPDADAALIRALRSYLQRTELAGNGHITAEIGDNAYLINYALSASFGWYLIDFIPLENIMQPIERSKLLFYMTTALLLLIALVCAALIYRNVQVPIHQLTRGVQRLRRGEYAYRVSRKRTDEFSYLFAEFNAMSGEIQRLIEKVYVEQINVREAKLRQLQSQINPHFLYNNFNFIQSMTQMGNKDAVIAFTQHLSRYYRSTTLAGDGQATVGDELALVTSYLEIHKMQMRRLQYEIDVDERLTEMRLPRLLLQPVVENAVVHGIENRLGDGLIRIGGELTDGGFRLTVDDNGRGMSEESIRRLMRRLDDPASDETGRGLMNVHQRLKHMFDPRSGLAFANAPTGGLRVVLNVVLRRA